MDTDPIRAKLKFLANLDMPLVYIPSKGGGDDTEHIGNFISCEVNIRNGRRDKPGADLDREGFALVRQETGVGDFFDESRVDVVWHEEVTTLLRQHTGAARIEIFDDTRRSASLERQRALHIREPAAIVHNDYTPDSGIRRLTDHFADDPVSARELRERRFAIINVWRSISGPVCDQPLALCDASTIGSDELVAIERRAEERAGELQVVLYSPEQRWYYFPEMQMHEALLIKTFDSATDGRARFTPHTSFRDPHAPANAPPRESIETRCFVFF